MQVKMRGQQFPVISNCATTGHKLQGYTAASLLVTDWTYTGNWAYTVLLHVRTMSGLYMINKLSDDLSKYEMASEVEDMLHDLRQQLEIEFFSEETYKKFITEEC